jgi:hypothetical protein
MVKANTKRMTEVTIIPTKAVRLSEGSSSDMSGLK